MVWQQISMKELEALPADPGPQVRAAIVSVNPSSAGARKLLADASALVRHGAGRPA